MVNVPTRQSVTNAISHNLYVCTRDSTDTYIVTRISFYLLTVMASSHSKSANSKRKKRTDESDGARLKEAPKKTYDSDNLDEDSESESNDQSKKRKHASPKKKQSPRKKTRRTDKSEDYEELGEGQEIVGVVVQAPKTGQVPPGQISQNTLDFLTNLKNPACNDREWYLLRFHSIYSKILIAF